MERSATRLILFALLAVATSEIALHWLLGHNPSSPLLAVYLTRNSAGEKYFNALVVDNIVPAAILGFVNGWTAFGRRSAGPLAAIAMGLAAFVAGLMPIYGLLIGVQNYSRMWGPPTSATGNLLNFCFAFFVAGGCTIGGYLNRRDWERKRR